MADHPLTAELAQAGPIPLDVTMRCEAGSVLAIFGPSGSGKTTVLRAVAGLYAPGHARVHAGGQCWTDTAAAVFVPPHRRAVGFVVQDYALFPHLSALRNVMLAMAHRPRRERQAHATALLGQIGLSDRLSRRPDELSGGERQRVAVARAIAREPAVLLLDEPFAALDRGIRRVLHCEIDTIRKQLHIPTLLVTHDFEDVARLATDVLLLESGKAVAQGSIGAVMSRPDLTWLRASVGLGSVFEARVRSVEAGTELAALAFGGGTLLVSQRDLTVGQQVRVRIPAREVILAVGTPQGLSVHNVLPATVIGVHADPAFDHPVLQLAIGDDVLLAEVTRDAIARLQLEPGRSVSALIKAVAVQVLGPARAPSPRRGEPKTDATLQQRAEPI